MAICFGGPNKVINALIGFYEWRARDINGVASKYTMETTLREDRAMLDSIQPLTHSTGHSPPMAVKVVALLSR